MEYLHIVLDLLILVLPLISIITGTVKGFTKLVLPFALTVIVMIVAHLYAGQIANYLTANYVHGFAVERLADRFAAGIEKGAQTLADLLPQQITSLLSSGEISADTAVASAGVPDLCEKIVTAAEPILIIPAVTIMVYAVFYILAKTFGAFLIKPAELIAKLPIISSVNRFLGFSAGLILGLLRLAIYIAVVAVIVMLAPDGQFAEAVSETQVLCLLTDEIMKLI